MMRAWHTTPKSRPCYAPIRRHSPRSSASTGTGATSAAPCLTAHEAGASKTELGRALGVSRQRVDEVLGRARHERAAGVGDVTD